MHKSLGYKTSLNLIVVVEKSGISYFELMYKLLFFLGIIIPIIK